MHLHYGLIVCKVFYVNKVLSVLARVYAVIAFASTCVKLFRRYKTSLSLSTERRWYSQVKEMLYDFPPTRVGLGHSSQGYVFELWVMYPRIPWVGPSSPTMMDSWGIRGRPASSQQTRLPYHGGQGQRVKSAWTCAVHQERGMMLAGNLTFYYEKHENVSFSYMAGGSTCCYRDRGTFSYIPE